MFLKVDRFNEITDNKVPYEFKPRRKGDISYCFADCSKAEDILGWKAKTLDDIINDCVTRVNYKIILTTTFNLK